MNETGKAMNETVRCHCGATVTYANPSKGCVNIGHFESTTGWFYIANTYSGEATWMCSKCYAKLVEYALAVEKLLGHPNVSLDSILKSSRRSR